MQHISLHTTTTPGLAWHCVTLQICDDMHACTPIPVILVGIISINDSATDSLPAFATHHVPSLCLVYLTSECQHWCLSGSLGTYSNDCTETANGAPDQQVLLLLAQATGLLAVVVGYMPLSSSPFVRLLRLDLFFPGFSLFWRLVSKSRSHCAV